MVSLFNEEEDVTTRSHAAKVFESEWFEYDALPLRFPYSLNEMFNGSVGLARQATRMWYVRLVLDEGWSEYAFVHAIETAWLKAEPYTYETLTAYAKEVQ